MPDSADLPQVAFRRLYVKAHQQLQQAGATILRLQDRVVELEAENARLRAQPPYSHGAPDADR